MAVQPAEFLSTAQSMVEDDKCSEIFLRNAASRAYYALYHKAKLFVEVNGITLVKVENSGSHEKLIETIRQLSEPWRSVAESMDRLKKFRHRCDYKLDAEVLPKKTAMHLAEVVRLIDRFDRS